MKIYINTDNYRNIAFSCENKLLKTAKKLDIEVVDDILKADIIFSIGGDGTFLKTARLSDNKPLIGINSGTVGYLTEIKPENIKNSLKDLKNGNFHVEKRMMLEGKIIRKNGEVVEISKSLNEIAISKNMFGVVGFDAIINDKYINSYTANGVLVCTPTGSTAYNLSCGGPVVDPTAEIIILTPIAPHTMINRSIVLSCDSIVKIKITELRENTKSYVLYDGNSIEVFDGDVILIYKSLKFTNIIKLKNRSFIDTIRENIS